MKHEYSFSYKIVSDGAVIWLVRLARNELVPSVYWTIPSPIPGVVGSFLNPISFVSLVQISHMFQWSPMSVAMLGAYLHRVNRKGSH